MAPRLGTPNRSCDGFDCRGRRARAYALDPLLHPALPLHFVLAYGEICDWDAVERVCREVLARNPADAEMAWQLSHAQWQRNDAAGAEATMRAVDAEPALLPVGLVWCGGPTHRRDAKRSIPPAELAPLLALPDVVFHPLTPNRSADVAAMAAQGYRVHDLTGFYEAGFDDVAAHVTALDAVVTIDSAPLHLGGALGAPVLAMLDHVSHWSWGNAQAQSWYDSVELYRQPEPGAWASVVERVVARLQAMVLGRAPRQGAGRHAGAHTSAHEQSPLGASG